MNKLELTVLILIVIIFSFFVGFGYGIESTMKKIVAGGQVKVVYETNRLNEITIKNLYIK